MEGNSSTIEEHHNEEIKENSRVFDCNTVLGVEISHLEEFMDTIFSDEVPKDFSDAMKDKIRVLKYSSRADNFKGKDKDTGLESNSFVCNNITHYFFFIAEKKENKIDISYKFFCGKAELIKAYDIIKGKKKVVITDYRRRLHQIVNNPLCLENTDTIRKALWSNILTERKNNLLTN